MYLAGFLREPTCPLEHLIGTPVAVEGSLVVWDLEGGEAWAAPLTPTEVLLTTRIWERQEEAERGPRGPGIGASKEKKK